MSDINTVDIYDFQGWIDLAPDHDWANLGAEAPATEPPPVGGEGEAGGPGL